MGADCLCLCECGPLHRPQEPGRGSGMAPGAWRPQGLSLPLGFLDTKTVFPPMQREVAEGCAPDICVSRILTDSHRCVLGLPLCSVETAYLPETRGGGRDTRRDSPTCRQCSRGDRRGPGCSACDRPSLKCWSFLPTLDIAQLGPSAPPHLWGLGQVGHHLLGASLPPRLNAETQHGALNILAK